MRALHLLKTTISRLANDRGGNFAMVTALIATPLLLAGGAAVDFSYASSQRTNLQEIADAAALEGGKVFDGTNLAAATTLAKAFIKGYSAQMPSDVASTMSADGRTFKVAMTASVPTSMMKIANINSVAIGVNAAAIAPVKPTKITFTPTQAQGYWYKKISIMVIRPGSPSEVTLGTIVYQPTTLNNAGQGTMTVDPPSGVINLDNYTKLILKMEIKTDYCGTGYAGSVSNNSKQTVTCTVVDAAYKLKNPGTWQQKMVYSNTLRTDNPDQMDSLYVDGKQLQKGTAYPLESYFGCSAKQSHAWEDGGGADRQDFFYTVSADCSGSDSNYVRLTQ
ncbi:TadE/TadG family type IV pilus assembly protein [Rhizobium sp. NPDC090275]|uniref:TadE/TadG family type IV pilus assembly protein n=1 Tax=Rhizobium sp. NPDC090275 TaxID=3364498 RepID=UPI00383B16CB